MTVLTSANPYEVGDLLALAERRRAYNVVRLTVDPFAESLSPLSADEATFVEAVGHVVTQYRTLAA